MIEGGELLESRVRRKSQARFGGGPMEKGRDDRHLASGLPYDMTTTVITEGEP